MDEMPHCVVRPKFRVIVHGRHTLVVAVMVLNKYALFSLSAYIASDPTVCNGKIEPLFPEYLLQSI